MKQWTVILRVQVSAPDEQGAYEEALASNWDWQTVDSIEEEL